MGFLELSQIFMESPPITPVKVQKNSVTLPYIARGVNIRGWGLFNVLHQYHRVPKYAEMFTLRDRAGIVLTLVRFVHI